VTSGRVRHMGVAEVVVSDSAVVAVVSTRHCILRRPDVVVTDNVAAAGVAFDW
jgi:hypothetical protein